jgi:hypothetical protein
LASGCANRLIQDREVACRILQDNRSAIDRSAPRALFELAHLTPAEADARSAYARLLSSSILSGLGAAALLSGFIVGFVVDPVTQPEGRIASYALGGGAIGVFALALVLRYTSRAPTERARRTLHAWADHCP